jgi:hemerythrin-like metal-binding protein
VSKQINWSEEYSVKNDSIDGQHQYLFDLCNTLYILVEQTESEQSVKQALLGLQDYIQIHFSDEENHYKDHPLLTDHKEMHQDFIKQTNGYIADYHKGSLRLIELADFVGEWLINHITIIDSQYFRDLTRFE